MSVELAHWFYRRYNRSFPADRDQAALVSVEVRSSVYPLCYGSPRHCTSLILYISVMLCLNLDMIDNQDGDANITSTSAITETHKRTFIHVYY